MNYRSQNMSLTLVYLLNNRQNCDVVSSSLACRNLGQYSSDCFFQLLRPLSQLHKEIISVTLAYQTRCQNASTEAGVGACVAISSGRSPARETKLALKQRQVLGLAMLSLKGRMLEQRLNDSFPLGTLASRCSLSASTLRSILNSSSMGISNYQNTKSMGSSQPENEAFNKLLKERYSSSQHYQHPVLGQIYLLKPRKADHPRIYYIERHYSTTQQFEQDLVAAKRRVERSYLSKRLCINYQVSETMCSHVVVRRDYFELHAESLADRLQTLKSQGIRLSLNQFRALVKFLIQSIADYHSQKMFFGLLSTNHILVRAESYVLVDYEACNPVAANLAKRQAAQPQMLKCVEQDRPQITGFNPFKLDVWCAGLVLVEAATLRKGTVSNLQSCILEIGVIYGHKLGELVRQMVVPQISKRVSSAELQIKLSMLLPKELPTTSIAT